MIYYVTLPRPQLNRLYSQTGSSNAYIFVTSSAILNTNMYFDSSMHMTIMTKEMVENVKLKQIRAAVMKHVQMMYIRYKEMKI